jgi:hypothetical protein
LKIKSDIFGRKPHLRKGSTDVYKLDWNEKILHSMIQLGHSMQITDTTLLPEIIDFINNKIITP